MTKMTTEDFDEVRIAFGGKHGDRMAHNPEQQSGKPELQAEAQRGGDRAVDDGDGARRAGEQDWLSQRAMERDFEALDHWTSAPPPNEKNERKKLDAANAMESPNTIWIRRRKPPAVSPNASVRPVTMMMITATIFATGP